MLKKPFAVFLLLPMITGLAFIQEGIAQDIDLYTTTPSLIEDNTILFDGIRVGGFGLSLENDVVKAKFVFDPETLSFTLVDYIPYIDVGIFHELCMFKDVEVAQPSYTANVDGKNGKKGEETIITAGQSIATGKNVYEFTATGSKPFAASFNLQTGNVMSFSFIGVGVTSKAKSKPDVKYRFIGPNTEIEGTIRHGYKGLLDPIKILSNGEYEFRIEPSNLEDSVTFKLNAFNANNRLIKQLTVDEKNKSRKLNERLAKNAWDYAKFQVTLKPGDRLEVPALKKQRASDGKNWAKSNENNKNLAIKLVDSTSHIVAYADNFRTLNHQNATGNTNDYYLCIYNKVGSSIAYNGTVFILADGEKKPSLTKPKPKPKPKSDEAADKPESNDGAPPKPNESSDKPELTN